MAIYENPEVQKFDIEELLTRKPPTDEHGRRQYTDTIKKQRPEAENPAKFSDHWEMILEDGSSHVKDRKVLAEHLDRGVLLDLGGGVGTFRTLLDENDIKPDHYVSVDKYLGLTNAKPDRLKLFEVREMPQKFLYQVLSNEGEKGFLRVEADMLDFLEYVPDASVNISINGIDYTLGITQDYQDALAKEIKRVCRPGGLVFGIESEVLDRLIKDPAFETLDVDMNGEDVYMAILRKKESAAVDQNIASSKENVSDLLK